jgi:rhodanese-related sulfurtransferase
VIETHPHADFISSHAEIAAATGADIYVNPRIAPAYSFKSFEDGQRITIGEASLRAISTPGHSPDSICIVLQDKGEDFAVFTGDTLMIGDVGRPDLREDGKNADTERHNLARDMYHSIHDKLMKLDDDVLVYPAHGGGSLCSRSENKATYSTIGQEKRTNPSLQPMEEGSFIDNLLKGQLFVPKYFPYDVGLNRAGAMPYEQAIAAVPRLDSTASIPVNALIIDCRPTNEFTRGHLEGAINLMDGPRFETWLGSIVSPGEDFYVIAGNKATADSILDKAAKIGYETNLKGIYTGVIPAEALSAPLPLNDFSEHPERYTIVDVRNKSERDKLPVFPNSLSIPLPELRERYKEIPLNKPIVVHCAAGYRSAAGASILQRKYKQHPVYDLGENILAYIERAGEKIQSGK